MRALMRVRNGGDASPPAGRSSSARKWAAWLIFVSSAREGWAHYIFVRAIGVPRWWRLRTPLRAKTGSVRSVRHGWHLHRQRVVAHKQNSGAAHSRDRWLARLSLIGTVQAAVCAQWRLSANGIGSGQADGNSTVDLALRFFSAGRPMLDRSTAPLLVSSLTELRSSGSNQHLRWAGRHLSRDEPRELVDAGHCAKFHLVPFARRHVILKPSHLRAKIQPRSHAQLETAARLVRIRTCGKKSKGPARCRGRHLRQSQAGPCVSPLPPAERVSPAGHVFAEARQSRPWTHRRLPKAASPPEIASSIVVAVRHLGDDGVESWPDLCVKHTGGTDDGDGDKGCDQAVLDGRRTNRVL